MNNVETKVDIAQRTDVNYDCNGYQVEVEHITPEAPPLSCLRDREQWAFSDSAITGISTMESTTKATEAASNHDNIVPTTISTGAYDGASTGYFIDAKNVASSCPFQYTSIDFDGESFWVNQIAFERHESTSDQYPTEFRLYYCWDCVEDTAQKLGDGFVSYQAGLIL